jgi:ABC transporter substrate binding protein
VTADITDWQLGANNGPWTLPPRTSAAARRLDCRDVDLLHGHHRIKRALCFIAPRRHNEPHDIDSVFAAMAQSPPSGVIVMPNVFTAVNRERIVVQAARFRVPTVYPILHFVATGGLVAYGVDNSDLFRRAAAYADRILRGAKPADLPVQQPTKFELMINLKTAQALGLTVSPSLLARADKVIE